MIDKQFIYIAEKDYLVRRMREFNGYCVPSDEYRHRYELEAQHNLELSEKVVQRDSMIMALQKELESIKQELGSTKQDLSVKNATVAELEAKAERRNKVTEEWMEKFALVKKISNKKCVLEDQKSECGLAANPQMGLQQQCLVGVEEKVFELAKLAYAVRDEVERMGSAEIVLSDEVQSCKKKMEDQRSVHSANTKALKRQFASKEIALNKQIHSYKKKIEEQRSVIADTESVNRQLTSKVEVLTNLYREASAKMENDASVIQNQANKIGEQKRQLGECNDFMTFVREREGELVARLGQLEEYYHMKRANQQCLLFRPRRKLKSAEKIVLGIGKLLVNEGLDVQQQFSSSNSCEGHCGQQLQC